MTLLHGWGALAGNVLCWAAMSYALTVCAAVRPRRRPSPSVLPVTPAVSLLKPLCGAETETYECLRSFCNQEYPNFQIVFGVCDGKDAAVAVVERLCREFPHLDLQLVVDRRLHGSSRKVSNLINMLPFASHDYLVVSDSDVRVTPGYLTAVVGPLLDAGVGIVTCAYRGVPRPGLWSRLGAMYINEWFIPSVQVAALAGSRAFAFGATIALRRGALAAIGGFSAIADQLADDYRLGEMTRQLGLRTVLCETDVETFVAESSLGALVRHELRWLRTIRAVRPVGYACSFVTLGIPLAFLGASLSGFSAGVLAALAVTAGARLVLHAQVREPRGRMSHLLLIPCRDLLTLILWGWSFTTRCVHWREDRYLITRDGTAQPILRT